ncbi:Zn-ribbon domain-containing OB-fold protein [[Eubacterium] cellulosolvens]
MGTLGASICTCGEVYIPPQKRCLKCTGTTHTIELEDSAVILSFTILHSPPQGFSAPLVLGLVEFYSVKGKDKIRPPKLLCEGRVPEAELTLGQKVRVGLDNNKYYFIKPD